MVESLTTNYGWTKPEVTKSASTWGGFLNDDLDSIDALVFANQQGIVPIGAIQMFAGEVAPANWLFCNGASLSTTTYNELFALFGYGYGGSGANFNLPNLVGRFPLGADGLAGLGATGGAATITLATANLPAHAHPIVDVAHSHGVNQWAHAHGDGGGHAHSVYQDPHSHVISGQVLTSGGGVNVAAGSGWVFPPANSVSTDTRQPAITMGTTHVGIDTQTSNISIQASGSNLSTTQNTGSGTPLSVVPPYFQINFIIRYQ